MEHAATSNRGKEMIPCGGEQCEGLEQCKRQREGLEQRKRHRGDWSSVRDIVGTGAA